MRNKTKTTTENILGLAKKAGAVIAGAEFAIEAVRKKRACHVFVSSDASPGTLKKLYDKTAFYQVPITKLNLTMSRLAHSVGLMRPTAAVAITNKSFLKLLNLNEPSKLTEINEEIGNPTEVHL